MCRSEPARRCMARRARRRSRTRDAPAHLGHPAGEHGGARVLVARRQHAQRADQPTSRQLRAVAHGLRAHARRRRRLARLDLFLDRQRQVAPAVLALEHVLRATRVGSTWRRVKDEPEAARRWTANAPRSGTSVPRRAHLGGGLELDADGGEGKAEAGVLEPALHLVHRLAAPPALARTHDPSRTLWPRAVRRVRRAPWPLPQKPQARSPKAAKDAAGQALGLALAHDGAERHRHLRGHVPAQRGAACARTHTRRHAKHATNAQPRLRRLPWRPRWRWR